MYFFLILLVGSVFLGTEILAISTPVAQMTPYRVLAFSTFLFLLYFMIQRHPRLKLKLDSYASLAIIMYLFWWLWAFISLLWVQDIRAWIQALFLLTLGISSILALYLWTRNNRQWEFLVRVIWFMMTLLVIWGFYEIISNNYLLADLGKLDKYGTFDSDPLTRIPITHFENQNDYATMLIAYISVNFILFFRTAHYFWRFTYLICIAAAEVLIFQSGSRMSLLVSLLLFALIIALNVKWDFSRRQVSWILIGGLAAVILAFLFLPPAQNFLDSLIYTGSTDILNGDTGRVNLIRNGLVFLAGTLGFGVGAGNIEHWMEFYRFLPTNNIINMHNWWFEILVAYGVLVFAFYVLVYGLMIYKLFQIRSRQDKGQRQVTNQLIAFLFAFILASITSANNMYIEWHWVFFGMILAYVSIQENKEKQEKGQVQA